MDFYLKKLEECNFSGVCLCYDVIVTSQWALETPKSPKLLTKHCIMPLPSLAAIAVREGTFQQGGGWNPPPPPAMLDQKKPGRIRVKTFHPGLQFKF